MHVFCVQYLTIYLFLQIIISKDYYFNAAY